MWRKIARTASPVRVRGSLDETCDRVSAVMGFTNSSHRTSRSSLDLNHNHQRAFVEGRRKWTYKQVERLPNADEIASRV